jgi:hypothetical protein
MSDQLPEPMDDQPVEIEHEMESEPVQPPRRKKGKELFLRIFFAILIFSAGFGGGFLLGGKKNDSHKNALDVMAMQSAINPQMGVNLDFTFGDIGPKLIEAGAIDQDAFVSLYDQSGVSLTAEEVEILRNGSQQKITLTTENSRFLLNLFWALGLANHNPLLEKGPMIEYSNGSIEGFASTGGWTLATKPVKEIYSKSPILTLNTDQQALVQKVADMVYRPCCNNPTSFPDCNHGMAMLGLLELMASQNATEGQMLNAAKAVNAYWFQNQTLEQAIYFKVVQKTDYANIDAATILGAQVSSASGYQGVNQWLQQSGLLDQLNQGGSSCGV